MRHFGLLDETGLLVEAHRLREYLEEKPGHTVVEFEVEFMGPIDRPLPRYPAKLGILSTVIDGQWRKLGGN